MKLVTLDNEEMVIANIDGKYFAFNNTCPHASGPLAEGELEGDTAMPLDVTAARTQTQLLLQPGL